MTEDQPQQPDRSEAPASETGPAKPLARLKKTYAASSFNSRMVLFSGIGCLTALLVLSVIAYSISRSNAMDAQKTASLSPSPLNSNPSASTAALTPQSHAKPSPIGRAQQQAHPAQPAQPRPQRFFVAEAPRPAPQPLQTRAAVVAPPAPHPIESNAPSLPLGVRMAADRDGFNNGCKRGRLVLEVATVTFTCPHDTSKSIAVSAGQVRSLDNNGIVVFPRQKYHFDIAGKQKQAVHELFAEWLANARRASTARASN
jgi:hypothetical protein